MIELRYLPVTFKIRFFSALECVSSVHYAFVLRSVLGFNLRSMCCIAHGKNCPDCMYNKTCAYAYIFETIIPQDNSIHAGTDRASHPFSFCNCSDSSFTVNLFGKACDYLPYIYAAFYKAGQKPFASCMALLKTFLFMITTILNLKLWTETYMDKELKEIIIASWLHDVGKFAQRAGRTELYDKNLEGQYCKVQQGGWYGYQHVIYTLGFLEKFRNILPDELDAIKITHLAAKHHSPSTYMVKLCLTAQPAGYSTMTVSTFPWAGASAH